MSYTICNFGDIFVRQDLIAYIIELDTASKGQLQAEVQIGLTIKDTVYSKTSLTKCLNIWKGTSYDSQIRTKTFPS